ncbi:MAG TPA: ABC transporter permease [Candidatus Dormibacteraeota bacterium]|jgi:ABC-type transport system involved in multi-copper enzyme maturation permease subunit
MVAARPRFFGIVKGEAVKLSRQLSIWLMLAGSLILLAVIVLGITSSDSVRRQLTLDPTGFFFNARDIFGTIFQIGSGIFILIVGSRLFAMEYSSGTIRIIYARGTGRFRFLLAKMLTMAVVGAVLLAGYLIVAGSMIAILVDSWAGGLGPIQHLPSEFWHDLGYWALVQGMSMSIAILMAAAATAIGRSLAFAMAASLAFFPVDNFVTILLALGARITRQDHPWLDITRYLLGPNLNVVLGLIEPGHHARPAFAAPLLPVDGTHALTVIGLYGLAFAVIAVMRTLRSDVLE